MEPELSPTISDIMERIQGYSPDADLKPVMTAYLLAARAHAGQTRKSGEPYLTHPLAVAMILAELRMDVETIATALLHDALEDNPITKEEMQAEIGATVVTGLVDGVTKIGKLRFRSREELAAENFRKMMLAMSRDLRVILVKLADRLHNMSTIQHHKPQRSGEQIASKRRTRSTFPSRTGWDCRGSRTRLEDYCASRRLHPEGIRGTSSTICRKRRPDRTVRSTRSWSRRRFEGAPRRARHHRAGSRVGRSQPYEHPSARWSDDGLAAWQDIQRPARIPGARRTTLVRATRRSVSLHAKYATDSRPHQGLHRPAQGRTAISRYTPP